MQHVPTNDEIEKFHGRHDGESNGSLEDVCVLLYLGRQRHVHVFVSHCYDHSTDQSWINLK